MTKVITGFLKCGEVFLAGLSWRCDQEDWSQRCKTAALEDGDRGQEQGLWATLKHIKGLETLSSFEPPEIGMTLDALMLAGEELCGLLIYRIIIINVYCLRLNVWSFVMETIEN